MTERSSSNLAQSSGDEDNPIRPSNLKRGKCKWFNVTKGWGFITPEDGGQDVFVHQSVLHMTGFRSLAEGETVEYECKESEKGVEATYVTGPDQIDLRGSAYHPNSKKRFRKTRCYNCGEFANHIAADCTQEPSAKKCHHCKSVDHLVADCPRKTDKVSSSQEQLEEEGATSTSTATNPS